MSDVAGSNVVCRNPWLKTMTGACRFNYNPNDGGHMQWAYQGFTHAECWAKCRESAYCHGISYDPAGGADSLCLTLYSVPTLR